MSGGREGHRQRLSRADVREAGITVLTGGTNVHLALVDLRDADIDGQQAEDRLASIGITVNRNAVPFDPRPPKVTSGLRIGTPALAARGFDRVGFEIVADLIAMFSGHRDLSRHPAWLQLRPQTPSRA